MDTTQGPGFFGGQKGTWEEWLGWGVAVLLVLVVMQSNQRAGGWLLLLVAVLLLTTASKRGVLTWTR